MPTWEDVCSLAAALPEAELGTSWRLPAWKVGGKVFVMQRPLGKKDREQLGAAAPGGPLVRLPCEHLHAKAALLAAHPDVLLTIPHFDGHAAVLLQLDAVSPDLLQELVEEAYVVVAPPELADALLARRG